MTSKFTKSIWPLHSLRQVFAVSRMKINHIYQALQDTGIPATSASTERAFSTAGLILNDRRNKLTDVMFEQMLVAKLNGDLL